MSINSISYANVALSIQAAQAAKAQNPLLGLQEEHSQDQPPRREQGDLSQLPATLELMEGDVLFYEGDQSGCAYYVESGCLEVSVTRDGKDVVIGEAKQGEIVGEMGVIVSSPRSATVRALTYARVRVVHAQVLDDMVSSSSPGVQALIRTLIGRLKSSVESA